MTVAFGYLWAALMFATAGANLAVAHWAGPVNWAWLIATFPIASKLVLTTVQYAATRSIVRRRIRAAKGVALSAS